MSILEENCVPPLLELARFIRRNHQRIQQHDSDTVGASQGSIDVVSTDPRTRLLSLRSNSCVVEWLYDRAKNPSDSTLQQGLWLELIGGLLGDTDASEKAVTLLEKPSQTDSLTDSGACTSDVVADDNNDDDDDESDLGTMVRAALARAQCAVSMAKTKRTLHSLSAAKRESVTQHQVKVYRVADLSTDGFLSRHAIPRIPCIIRGACPDMQSPSGPLSTFASLRTCLTGKRGNLKRRVKGSASWASLEVATGGPHKLDDFVAEIALNSVRDSAPDSAPDVTRDDELTTAQLPRATPPPFYLHDWSLPQFAPELATLVDIPKYFARDMLQKCDEGSLLRDTWPSLFVAPQATESALHVDSCGTHFWMQVLHGTKFWRIFPHDETALLDPVFIDGSFDPCFDPTVSELCRTSAPKGTHPWECHVNAGDIIFVPASCAHYVKNVTATIAVSMNYIDATNVDTALQALHAAAITDNRARKLHANLIRINARRCAVVSADGCTEETKEEATTSRELGAGKDGCTNSAGGQWAGHCIGKGDVPNKHAVPYASFKKRRTMSSLVSTTECQ